ncbi:MAG: hypothetical protein MUE85_15630 [Microscillaceae bacterium]|jgi:uncharacterized protein YlxW (UPF0749 family)|nr:hypothetical protein [Microscillaceae bacterium]
MDRLFELIFHPGVIIPMMVLSIPLAAVIGTFYLKAQKLKLGQGGMSNDDAQLVKRALLENQDLKQRVGNLEAIITSMDKEILALKASETDDQRRVQELSDKLKNF